MGVHTHDDKNEQKPEKNTKNVLFQKDSNIIVIGGSTECQFWKNKNSFPSGFLVVKENLFHEKRILNGLVKKIKGVSQECCKKGIFQEKNFHEKSFSEMFFWMILLSVRVQRSEDRKKILFRVCFLFFNRESLWKWSDFWKIWYKFSTGYTGLIKKIKIFFQEK